MMLVEAIADWQLEALSIAPPTGTDRLPAVGGLPGPTFFPEGMGLSHQVTLNDHRPTNMAIGHNFGCASYREEIGPAGREDDKSTWRNLDALRRIQVKPRQSDAASALASFRQLVILVIE